MSNLVTIQRHEINAILKIALPLMAAFLAQKGMQLIDTFMMGWIGIQALAAGALGGTSYFIVLIFCMGTLSSVGVYIARYHGANQPEMIRATLQNGLFLAILLSIPGMITLWFMPNFLLLIGEPAQVVAYAKLFLHALLWGFPGLLLFLVFREFISAFSLARVIMFVSLGSMPLTFLLNYIFIYGKLGLPAMGIAGIGYASACILWLMFFCLWFYSSRNQELKSYITSFHPITIKFQEIKSLVTLGVPSGFMLLIESGMFSAAAFMIGHIGVTALAAHQVAMQYASLAFSTPFALSMATALLVGRAIGANDLSQAKRYTVISIIISLLIAITVGLIFFVFPEKLAFLFLNSHEANFSKTIALVISFLTIAIFFQCFDALQTILCGALRGFKDTFVPMILCLFCYWIIGIGSAYYFAFYTTLSAAGIWYGLTLGICSTAVFLSLRFYFVYKNYSRQLATS